MSAQRSLKRSELKAQYERFCAAWRNEKRFQEFTLSTGGVLEKGMNRLGRKPTFQMWKQALDSGAFRFRPTEAAEAVVPDKSVPVESTSWDDDGSI